MTDLLTPEMQAMLRIGGALKLATTPDQKPKPKRVQSRTRNVPPEPRRATDTGDSVDKVVEYPVVVTAPLSASEPEPFEDAYSAHEVLSDPIQPVKRGRGRPRKNAPVVRQPAGVLRRSQIAAIMAGNWEVTGEIKHDVRDIPTACNYKAKRVFILRDKTTGRTIQAASGEIHKHTSLVLPEDGKRVRKLAVADSFA